MKCWINGLFIAGVAAAFWTVTPVRAEPAFTPDQRGAIEKIVREYLLKHPELMIEVMTKLEQRQEADAETKRRENLSKHKVALFTSAEDFVVNPDGKVPMVEFFDYQCGYCKRVLRSVLKVTSDQPDVRVAFKEYPILGPLSVYAAKASIASKNQGKYLEFHTAVMAVKGRLSEQVVLAKAADVGLDIDRLKKDMESDEVQAVIDSNIELGRTMDIRGTPTLIIGDNLVPGAIPYSRIVELIGKTRQNCSVC
jgi:protein-disulfide isomerase